MNFGFIKVAAAVPHLKVADCSYNSDRIAEIILKAEDRGIQIIVFPELAVTAYTCGDLLQQPLLVRKAEENLCRIIERTKSTGVLSIIGLPVYADNQLFNCAAVISGGDILGVVPKSYVPGYSEFYEERWFAPAAKATSIEVRLCGKDAPFGTDILFNASEYPDLTFAIELCEDLWVPIPPSSYHSVAGANVIFNLSASNEIIGKSDYRRELVKQQSAKCACGYVYTSSGVHESTTDLVFGGHAVISEYGTILAESKRFFRDEQIITAEIDVEKLLSDRRKSTSFMEVSTGRKYRKVFFPLKAIKVKSLERLIDPHPFVPFDEARRDERCGEIFAIQTSGLAKRLEYASIKRAAINISGGLDSTLALLVTVKAFDMLGRSRENITAITLPGFGTTGETYSNAMGLMKSLGATIREINIKEACLQHFRDIGHDPAVHDVTYENVQARERTQVLMDIANKEGALAIGTGDLSELALGWCTYNGDHMSMYGVNAGVPKTLVKYLVQWAADNAVEKLARDVLYRIIDTPISPELIPPDENGEIRQKTEDIVGPYELHDFFLYHMLRYGAHPKKIMFLAEQAFMGAYTSETIKKWLKVFYKRFFSQQFKRSCLPDGPKVGTISLSPRGDWRMPSDAEAVLWLEELDE